MRAAGRLQLAGVCAAGAALLWLAPAPADTPPTRPIAANPSIDRGADLFAEQCSSCHGFDAAGVSGRGPDLRGTGAAAADFYLSTGRMPLAHPGDQPMRASPRYGPRQIDDLIHYLASFGGTPIPTVEPERGNVADGQQLFSSNCSGCHAITGEGGVAVGAYAPPLQEATPRQIAEAIRVGPYLMPAFGPRQLDAHAVDSIARYVTEVVDSPDDRGGWGIGHIGPVPEGMVAWLLAAVALALVALAIGERTRGEAP